MVTVVLVGAAVLLKHTQRATDKVATALEYPAGQESPKAVRHNVEKMEDSDQYLEQQCSSLANSLVG